MRIIGLTITGLLTVIIVAGCASMPKARQDLGPYACSESDGSRRLVFAYVHGVGANDEKARANFQDEIENLHRYVLTEFSHHPEIQAGLLDNCTYHIASEPLVFLWGGVTAGERQSVSYDDLVGADFGGFAGSLRRRLAIALYDISWLNTGYGRALVGEQLNGAIAGGLRDGDALVLWGHSAGGVLITNYLVDRARYVDVNQVDLFKREWLDEALGDFHLTCFAALFETKLIRLEEGVFSGMFLDLPPTPGYDFDDTWAEYAREQLARLPDATEAHCLPPGALQLVTLAGSPVAVINPFSPSMESFVIDWAVAALIESGMTLANIVHQDDIIGIRLEGYESFSGRLNSATGAEISVVDPGVSINRVTGSEGANMINAHGWYLAHPEQFVRVWADTLVEAYQETQ